MADERNAIKHKVVHRSDRRRRQCLRYLRIGGAAVLFFLFLYILWNGDNQPVENYLTEVDRESEQTRILQRNVSAYQ